MSPASWQPSLLATQSLGSPVSWQPSLLAAARHYDKLGNLREGLFIQKREVDTRSFRPVELVPSRTDLPFPAVHSRPRPFLPRDNKS
jgi:hypothetical protein